MPWSVSELQEVKKLQKRLKKQGSNYFSLSSLNKFENDEELLRKNMTIKGLLYKIVMNC